MQYFKSPPVQIRRDSFARANLYRIKVPAHASGTVCSWCGNKRYNKGKEMNTLFNYAWQEDSIYGGLDFPQGKGFCGINCYNNYNNM